MKSITRIGLLALAGLLAALVAAGSAFAVTITPPATAVTGNLSAGNAVFTSPAATITCNTHTTQSTTANPASDRATIPAASNRYSSGGGNCTTNIAFTTARVDVSAAWTLTATSTTAGRIDVPASAARISFQLGGSTVCSITVNASNVPMSWNNTTKILATSGANTVNYTSTGGACGRNGTATQQESLLLSGGISVT